MTGNDEDASLPQSSEYGIVSQAETFSSSDAYMLMYIRRNSKNGVEGADVEFAGNIMEKEGDMLSSQNNLSLPSHICEELNQSNSSYLDACQQYKLKKILELDLIMERRQEVRSVLSEAPVQLLGEPYFWISTDWLRQWADSITTS